MLILPNGDALTGSSTVDRILADDHMKRLAASFIACKPVDNPLPVIQKGILIVLQGEQALVSRSTSNISFLGSSDATTCVILALLSEEMAWIAHCDEGTSMECLNSAISDMAVSGSPVSVFMMGGFDDPRRISRTTIEMIVGCLHQHTAKLTLALACVLSLNTTTRRVKDRYEPVPIYQSLIINLDTSTATSAPANIKDQRGPQLPRRFSYHHCCSHRSLVSIFDRDQSLVVIPEVSVNLSSSHLDYLQRILSIEDEEQFLMATSTSPNAEPDHFVEDIRSAYSWLISNQGQKLPALSFEFTTSIPTEAEYTTHS